MATLKTIPVRFDQEAHTYTNTESGVMYKGITGTLLRRVFPDKYANIPEAVLQKAAERGTLIHEEIELAQSIGITPTTQEAQNYMLMREEMGMKYLTSEYTVSDMEHYATNIDVVYDVDEQIVDIGDYKTTYKLDKEAGSWQLSIDAFFFEKNNPGIKVRKLYLIWLRGEIAEVVEVPRKTDKEIADLIAADLADEPYNAEPMFPDYFREREAALEALTRRIKEMTAEADTIKAELLQEMGEHGDKSFDTGSLLVTYVAPSKRASFDSTRFKKEHADMYGEYMKESETKASLKITLR